MNNMAIYSVPAYTLNNSCHVHRGSFNMTTIRLLENSTALLSENLQVTKEFI